MSAQPGTLTRLRPVVQVTPIPGGLHARGWSSSFTIRGGQGLHRVWEVLERRLADGLPEGAWYPASAPADVRSAVDRIQEALSAHDMLVRVPLAWDEPARSRPSAPTRGWLESVADDPARAWAALQSVTFAVHGQGPVAWAAVRALTEIGLEVDPQPSPRALGRLTEMNGDPVAITCGDLLGWVAADDTVGVVLPVARDLTAAGAFEQLRDRVGMGRRVQPPSALHSLVGAAAAHRMICAVAGLPDPGQTRGARRGAGEQLRWTPATVLVARMDPLRAAYHPWLGVPAASAAPARSLEEAAARLAALTDVELGLAEDHDRDDAVQIPAAVLALRAGTVVSPAVGPTAEWARVVAGTGLVAQLAGSRLGRPVIAGANIADARGRALRQVWAQLPPGQPANPQVWADHAAARRWWKALTLHFAADAALAVDRLADGVCRAVASVPGEPPSVAVEATPGDAAAMAALGLVGRLQWADRNPARGGDHVAAGGTEQGQITQEVLCGCGSTPPGVDPQAPRPGWDDDAWSWPSGVGAREADLQDALTQLPDGRVVTVHPVADPAVADLLATHVLVEVSS